MSKNSKIDKLLTAVLAQQKAAKPRPRRRRRRRKTSNTVMTGVSSAPMAIATTVRNRSNNIVVRHREYVQDISIPVSTFNVESFVINPGNPILFPWLSAIAPSFETYRIRRLNFHYVSSAPSTCQGTVFAVIDYDQSDEPPVDKLSLLNCQGATRSSIWKSFELTGNVPAMNLYKRYYVSTSGTTLERVQDVGVLYVGSSSTTDYGITGELWIDYEVELCTPQVYTLPVGFRYFVGPTTSQSTLPTGGTFELATQGGEPRMAGNINEHNITARYEGMYSITFIVALTGCETVTTPAYQVIDGFLVNVSELLSIHHYYATYWVYLKEGGYITFPWISSWTTWVSGDVHTTTVLAEYNKYGAIPPGWPTAAIMQGSCQVKAKPDADDCKGTFVSGDSRRSLIDLRESVHKSNQLMRREDMSTPCGRPLLESPREPSREPSQPNWEKIPHNETRVSSCISDYVDAGHPLKRTDQLKRGS